MLTLDDGRYGKLYNAASRWREIEDVLVVVRDHTGVTVRCTDRLNEVFSASEQL